MRNKDIIIHKNMSRKREIELKAGALAHFGISHNEPRRETEKYREGFVDGAKWADNTMIERSFMWFLKHCLEYVDGDCGAVEFNTKIKDMYNAYKKAMEE